MALAWGLSSGSGRGRSNLREDLDDLPLLDEDLDLPLLLFFVDVFLLLEDVVLVDD